MVKVCFICNTPFIENAAIQNLRDELDWLSEKEPEVEFSFWMQTGGANTTRSAAAASSHANRVFG